MSEIFYTVFSVLKIIKNKLELWGKKTMRTTVRIKKSILAQTAEQIQTTDTNSNGNHKTRDKNLQELRKTKYKLKKLKKLLADKKRKPQQEKGEK